MGSDAWLKSGFFFIPFAHANGTDSVFVNSSGLPQHIAESLRLSGNTLSCKDWARLSLAADLDNDVRGKAEPYRNVLRRSRRTSGAYQIFLTTQFDMAR